jgi:hypothetical protein
VVPCWAGSDGWDGCHWIVATTMGVRITGAVGRMVGGSFTVR